MQRLALGVQYDGTDFLGWQAQANGRTVQAVLDAAISSVASSAVVTHAAGRTDTGVHASNQVAHFDTSATRAPRQWRLGINSNLPEDVKVTWVHEVNAEFDARRSATARRYRYLIVQAGACPVLARRFAWCIRDRLDHAAMTRAVTALLGEHDFSAFRAAGCQSRSAMRFLSRVSLRMLDDVLSIEFTANAFLYHMVRNLVGTLVEIGRTRKDPSWACELLEGGDRKLAAPTAPASGLSLVGVEYPDVFGLPSASELLMPL